MSESHAWQVAILTHESTDIPFEETIANLFTQFFVSLGVCLHTSILVDGIESVVGQKQDTRGRAKSLTHGMRSSATGPTRLCFSCNGRLDSNSKHMVYTEKNERQPGTVTLHVIGDSKMSILLVCRGDDILQTYIQTYRDEPHPDILM